MSITRFYKLLEQLTFGFSIAKELVSLLLFRVYKGLFQWKKQIVHKKHIIFPCILEPGH